MIQFSLLDQCLVRPSENYCWFFDEFTYDCKKFISTSDAAPSQLAIIPEGQSTFDQAIWTILCC